MNTHMKLFKATTKVESYTYVDWYQAGTEQAARTQWESDCKRYGLPSTATLELVECDSKTLKPLTVSNQ